MDSSATKEKCSGRNEKRDPSIYFADHWFLAVNIGGNPAVPMVGCCHNHGIYVFERQRPAAVVYIRHGHDFHAGQRSLCLHIALPHDSESDSEAGRAPTAIELGCADPDEPCNLPNALVSDPPLKQVVTRTLEAGVRSAQESNFRWSAGWFRAENYNDLLFVASEQTGFGYSQLNGAVCRQIPAYKLAGPAQTRTAASTPVARCADPGRW